jgi:uncharacterized protein (DUF885 family)
MASSLKSILVSQCVRRRLAPEGSASAPYYNPPSEDLSRPGTTWIPMLGKNEVSNWHLVSTWYHEAVPGHHLQVGTATVEKDRLTRYQRQLQLGLVVMVKVGRCMQNVS